MSCNLFLLTTTTILSVVVPSHTAISIPLIPTSELIRTYCNVTDNSNVFSHDAIPLHSSDPIDLLSNTLYCKASTILEETKNISYVCGATAESSLDIAHGASLTRKAYLMLLVLGTIIYAFLALALALALKITSIEDWRLRWRGLMSNDSGSSAPMNIRKVYYHELVVSVLTRVYEGEVKPDVVIEHYLLKEAFEELERHPEIYEDPNLYDFATEFMLETIKRVVFMKIPTDKKVAWLKNRYISNMLVVEKLFF